MQRAMLPILRCPVTRSKLQLRTIKTFVNGDDIDEGVLFADEDCFYPVIKGIPRLTIEAFLEYRSFLEKNLEDYADRKKIVEDKYAELIKYVQKKNRRTKKSFSLEWKLFKYQEDKTWNNDTAGLLDLFLTEIDEKVVNLEDKLIFDAGCGNGVLDMCIAEKGGRVFGMDLSLSIETAYSHSQSRNAWFIQGDVQFPPVAFEYFDIVYCSGVLIHTNNTELSFSRIDRCVKKGGKLSVWLYHPGTGFVHKSFNSLRKFTSRLPIRLQYYLYKVSIFPVAFIVKRLKGNKQNTREMMIDIMDWLSPEFRREHTHEEAGSWFTKRNYNSVKITTDTQFGFNIIGIKQDVASSDKYIEEQAEIYR